MTFSEKLNFKESIGIVEKQIPKIHHRKEDNDLFHFTNLRNVAKILQKSNQSKNQTSNIPEISNKVGK